MEKSTINTLMEANGYDEFIGDLFADWEYVKDEMLLPERKTGTGNGTVHVYLLQSNMDKFSKCFSSYIIGYKRGQNIADSECPTVSHYCQVSNLVALASSTYHYYGCNDLVFSLVEYLKELLAYEQDGFIRFESIFKLSSEDRPYFKQFTKKVFSRLVRSLFISEKSAYKISLYRNSVSCEVAAYWMIGLALDSAFLIPAETLLSHDTGSTEEPIDEPVPNTPADPSPETESSISNKDQFVSFMTKINRRQSTIENYITVLDNILPRLIRENLDASCISLFYSTDYAYLLDLENKLWKTGPIQEYNLTGHNQLSAAFHRYMDFAQSLLSDDELGKILFTE